MYKLKENMLEYEELRKIYHSKAKKPPNLAADGFSEPVHEGTGENN